MLEAAIWALEQWNCMLETGPSKNRFLPSRDWVFKCAFCERLKQTESYFDDETFQCELLCPVRWGVVFFDEPGVHCVSGLYGEWTFKGNKHPAFTWIIVERIEEAIERLEGEQ